MPVGCVVQPDLARAPDLDASPATSAGEVMGAARWLLERVLMTGTYRSEMRSKSNRWERVLLALFGVVAASFLSATAYSQYRATTIDDRARQIADVISPAIERLATVRSDVRRLQAAATSYTQVKADELPIAFGKVQAARQALQDDTQKYLAVQWGGREREIWDQSIEPKLEELKYVVRRIVEEVQAGDFEGAQSDSHDELARVADDAGAALLRGQDMNASIARDLAFRIARTRERSALLGWLLDVLCTLTAAAGAVLLVRVHRRQALLMDAHSHLLEQRNQELEEFAGRVAHDILSPLATISMTLGTLEMARGDLPERPALGSLIARGARSVRKVQTIVDGLLEFARAGAHPTPGAQADVQRAVEDALVTLAPAAERNHVTLSCDPPPSCAVACNPGVLSSLVSNLIENAIKYMGESPVRRVTIHVRDEATSVHFEVEDTGPGIPSELAPKVFSPYVRGTGTKQPGIGLGLATVKRMVEAHGGAVGVRTALGRGSTFWFHLPKATAPAGDRTRHDAMSAPEVSASEMNAKGVC